MIQKLTTSEMMEEFNNVKNKIESTKDSINTIKTNIENKLKILLNEHEYISQNVLAIKDSVKTGTSNDRVILANNSNVSGQYDSFGMTIHPKLTKTPRNILNYIGTQGVIFKNNVAVYVNEQLDDNMKYFLMHDSITNKQSILNEYDTNKLTISIQITDIGLGDTTANMIEISPYLAGSFDIDSVDVYEYTGIDDGTLSQRLSTVEDVGRMRIILSEKTKISKVEFEITLKYKNSDGKYVFGLRHLYFLNADFADGSYIVAKVDSDDYISYIYDNLTVRSQYGDTATTISNEDGEIYREYSDGVLSKQLNVSTQLNPQYISSNIKSFYLKLPISTSIISFVPTITNKESN
jgi:hypothetical protein